MANANQIALELTKFSDDMIRKLILDITANLVQKTPVDTGWASVNWIPRIGTPFSGTEGTQGQHKGKGEWLGSNTNQQAGILDIATKAGVGDTIFVTNNVPYIERLNEGHSPQAPAGFVQAAIDEAIKGLSGVTKQ